MKPVMHLYAQTIFVVGYACDAERLVWRNDAQSTSLLDRLTEMSSRRN